MFRLEEPLSQEEKDDKRAGKGKNRVGGPADRWVGERKRVADQVRTRFNHDFPLLNSES
jgi:hypothetical protein